MVDTLARGGDFIYNLFPGHGGMMDRLDSLLFMAIVIYVYLSIRG